jgi:hypothetical protein
VRSRIQVAAATWTSHHKMVIRKSTPPRVSVDAKTARTDEKPSMSSIDLVGTVP